jgi:hypothetical protein
LVTRNESEAGTADFKGKVTLRTKKVVESRQNHSSADSEISKKRNSFIYSDNMPRRKREFTIFDPPNKDK